MLKIGTDVDGVWTDFGFGAWKAAKDEGFRLPFRSSKEMTVWNYMEKFMGPEKWGKLWNDIRESRVFWETLPPLGHIPVLHMQNLFKNPNVTLYLITSREGSAIRQQTIRWFNQYVQIDIPDNNVFICRSREKVDFVNDLGLDYYVEDHPEVLTTIAKNKRDNLKLYGIDVKYTNCVDRSLPINWVPSVTYFLEDIWRENNDSLATAEENKHPEVNG